MRANTSACAIGGALLALTSALMIPATPTYATGMSLPATVTGSIRGVARPGTPTDLPRETVAIIRDPLTVLAELGAVRLDISRHLVSNSDDRAFSALSANDLRTTAAMLREMAARGLGLGSISESTLQAVGEAQKLLRTRYPSLSRTSTATTVAALLESLATYHDDQALRRAHLAKQDLVDRGYISGHIVPPAGLPGLARTNTEDLALRALLALHQKLYAELVAGVRTKARTTVADLQTSYQPAENPAATAAALTDAWLRLGHRRLAVVLTGIEQIGVPYLFAGRDPSGFDCSGFTHYAWTSVGTYMRKSSFAQRDQVRAVDSVDLLQAGDLFFYEGTSPYSRRNDKLVGHVGIYLGVRDLMIDASATAGDVRVARINPQLLWGLGALNIHEELTDELFLP